MVRSYKLLIASKETDLTKVYANPDAEAIVDLAMYNYVEVF